MCVQCNPACTLARTCRSSAVQCDEGMNDAASESMSHFFNEQTTKSTKRAAHRRGSERALQHGHASPLHSATTRDEAIHSATSDVDASIRRVSNSTSEPADRTRYKQSSEGTIVEFHNTRCVHRPRSSCRSFAHALLPSTGALRQRILCSHVSRSLTDHIAHNRTRPHILVSSSLRHV